MSEDGVIGLKCPELFWYLTKNEFCFQKFEPIPDLISENFLPIYVLKNNEVIEVINQTNLAEIKDKKALCKRADVFVLIDELPAEFQLQYEKSRVINQANNGDYKLFVSIVSYRDPQLRATLEDLFEKAERPEDIRVFCFSQESDLDDFNLGKEEELFKQYAIDFETYPSHISKGVCWARAYAQEKYLGEKYFLQIDSHMRFAEKWDLEMIDLLHEIEHPKAIISCYPPHFDPDSDQSLIPELVKTKVKSFSPNYSLIMQGVHLDERDLSQSTIEHGWISAGFMFSYGEFVKELKYDPYLYFQGEENDLSLRAFEKGWKSYAPKKCLIWHYYFHLEKKTRIRHWDEKNDWERLSNISDIRIKYKLNLDRKDRTKTELVNIDGHYVESQDVITKFERLLGVHFASKEIHHD